MQTPKCIFYEIKFNLHKMYYDALNKELIPKGAFKVPIKKSITILTLCGGDAQ